MSNKKKKKQHGFDSETDSTLVHPYFSEVLSTYRKTLNTVIVFSFFINLLMLSVPLYLLQIYDRILPNRSTETLLVLMLIVFAAIAVLGALEAVRSAVISKLGTWFENRMSEHLLSGTMTRAIEDETSSGTANILKDLNALKDLLAGPHLVTVLDVLWTPIFLGVLYWLHPLLGALVTMGILIMVALGYINEKRTRNLLNSSKQRSHSCSESVNSYMRNRAVIQAMGMQNDLVYRWRSQQQSSADAQSQTRELSGKTRATMKSLRLFLQIIVLSAAAWLILQGSLTGGATMASLILMQRAASPFERLISSWKYVIKARSAFTRINRRIDYAPSLKSYPDMPEPRGPLTVESLRYRRSGDAHGLLSGLNLKVKPGEITAIVGPTASGKTTLMELLVGIIRPSSGQVMLDGYDISHWHPQDLGKAIGYLPQDVELFDGSVRQNIARMTEGNVQKILEATRITGIHEMIQRYPQGYDTLIGEGGNHLSAGERQRIALARAIYGSPKLLVLDEPDASLDIPGKKALVATLKALKEQDTMIVMVSHHPEILRYADSIYEIENRQLKKLSRSRSSKSSSRRSSTSKKRLKHGQ